MNKPSDMAVAVAGLGAIGKVVASALDRRIPGLRLSAVSAKNREKARDYVSTLSSPVPVVALNELASHADIVVECTPAELLPEVAHPVLAAGKTVVVLSAGALLSHPSLQAEAIRNGGKIVVPTGALIGLDAVVAAAEGAIRSVRMITRKPPAGLQGAPYLLQNNIDLDGLVAPRRVFSGSARDAAKGFPANLNVAVALSLAGIGPDRTVLEIWADPGVSRNVHRIEVDSDSASFSMTIENIPSENPKTGLITARSVVALLRKINAPLRVGT